MFDKNAISKENLYYANLKREKRIKDQLDEMEREKIAMDKLRDQIEQDKLYQIEKKNRIKQNLYEDYNNYLKQKYSTPPQFREKLNIKVGGEERNIKKTNYNEEMDKLCINPTTEKNIYPSTPTINYSEMGRNYQKGYSHGYNIITGEAYTNPVINQNNNKRTEENEKYLNKKNESQQNYNNFNISPEEYEEFLKYKEMKKQKEIEELEREKYRNYINQNANNTEMRQNEDYPQYGNAPNYNREEKTPYFNNNQYQSDQSSPDYQNEQYFKDRITEKDMINNNEQINPYYQQKASEYSNYLKRNRKENFHYEKDNINPELQKEEKDNLYNNQNKLFENYQKGYLQNQQRERETESNNNYLEKYPPNYYQRGPEPISSNNYNYNDENLKRDIEYQRELEKRELSNMPTEYQQNNKLSEYEKEMMLRQKYNDDIQFRNNIPFPDNQQMPQEKNNNYLNENIKDSENQKYKEFLKNKSNDNIKDIERDKYMQFLLNKTKENQEQKEQKLNYNEFINKQQNYPNENNINYKEEMRNYYDAADDKMQNNNYYQNQEKEYYDNNQKMPLQYNNYIAQNAYQNQNQFTNEREREIQAQNYQEEQEPKFLSYKEQIERIKSQEQRQNQDLENEQNNNIPLNENNINNKNIKEIISEYNKNRAKNSSTEDNIFKVNQVPQAPPKYNDEPLSSKERKQIQRDYAKYLEWQINEKNERNSKTPSYQKYNPILDNNNMNNNKYEEGDNPYQQIREKYSPKNDIPPNPYSNKNYDINSKSNLGYNPISQPNYNKNFPLDK